MKLVMLSTLPVGTTFHYYSQLSQRWILLNTNPLKVKEIGSESIFNSSDQAVWIHEETMIDTAKHKVVPLGTLNAGDFFGSDFKFRGTKQYTVTSVTPGCKDFNKQDTHLIIFSDGTNQYFGRSTMNVVIDIPKVRLETLDAGDIFTVDNTKLKLLRTKTSCGYLQAVDEDFNLYPYNPTTKVVKL